MSFTVIIPARLASTRLPNKPIADICGKPMIVRVAEQALKSGASRVICAVDDELILKACEANGIEACLTRNVARDVHDGFNVHGDAQCRVVGRVFQRTAVTTDEQ